MSLLSSSSSKVSEAAAIETRLLPLAQPPCATPPLPSSAPWRRLARRAAFVALCLLSAPVAVVSYRYLVPSLHRTVQQGVVTNPYARPFLYIHIAGAATALLLGPLQFMQPLRRRYLRLHRLTGRVYVLCCLVGGVTALPIAVRSSGFFAMALVWLLSTCIAWRLAVQGRISEHERWMVRSFAATFTAVTFRVLIVATPPVTGCSFVTAYGYSTWASWMLDLLAVELWMRYSGMVAAQPVAKLATTGETETAICVREAQTVKVWRRLERMWSKRAWQCHRIEQS